MNKAVIQKTIFLLFLIGTCTGCHVQKQKTREIEEADTALQEDAAGKEITEDAELIADAEQAADLAENPARQDPANAKLLCLQSGDMETLLGLSFGDRIDYTRFEVSGSGKYGPLYCEIDAQAGSRAYFFFQGKEHGFGGFRVTNTELGFLGLDQSEDRLERMIDLFGKQDEFERDENDDSIRTATWNFEKASLYVTTRRGYISSVEYLAADGVADGIAIPWEQTDLAKDYRGEYDYFENIYRWEAIYDSNANEAEFSYHPYDDDYDAGQVETVVDEYLQRQGIYKKQPDGVAYNRHGEPFIEYYIEEKENKYCFVVHLWGDYWIDYEAGISEYQDAVYCTTHVLEDSDWTTHVPGESDWIGTLLYNIDEENGITRERLYDTEGMRKADISYINMTGMPFSLVTDYRYVETGFDAGCEVLCRSQKFWFDKEQAELDEAGRFVRYNGVFDLNSEDAHNFVPGRMAVYDGYFSYPCTCVYDKKGRLSKIEEDLLPEDEEYERANSGQIEFQYDANGILMEARYDRSSWTQGTTDSSGIIEYDEKGRMICNDYYITHGGHTDIFLYKDDSDLPWAYLNWCSFAPGFTNVYLFL